MTLACHICESNCVNKLVVEYFLLAIISPTQAARVEEMATTMRIKKMAGKEQECRQQGAGSRKPRPEARHIFRLKCHNMLTSSRDNDSDNELNEQHQAGRQAGRQAGNNNLTYIFIFILILFLSARAIVGFITFIVAVLVVIAVASHGNSVKEVMWTFAHLFFSKLASEVKAKNCSCQGCQAKNLRCAFVLMLPGDIKRRFQGLRLVKRCRMWSELQIRWELKVSSWVSYAFGLCWDLNFTWALGTSLEYPILSILFFISSRLISTHLDISLITQHLLFCFYLRLPFHVIPSAGDA